MPALRSSSGLACVRCALALLGIITGLIAKPIAPHGLGPFLNGPHRTTSSDADLLDAPATDSQFDTTSLPLPPNIPSLGFHATATSEFGDLFRLKGASHFVDSVTVTMSSWAIHSDFPESSPLGFTHPVSMNLYAVDRSGGAPKPGALIVTVTQSFLIPWRPEPDPSSGSSYRLWKAADGNYYTGLAFNLTFDLASLGLALPDELIIGLTFSTQHHGPVPIGLPGPYDFLHIGVSDQPPHVGIDVESDAVFWRTGSPAHYADGGSGGVNTLRRDTGWLPYKPAIRVNNSSYGVLAGITESIRSLESSDSRTVAILNEALRVTTLALERSLWDGNNRLHPDAGHLVFDLAAEGADDLAAVADRAAMLEAGALEAMGTLLSFTQSLAETALADAILGGGNAHYISRGHAALDNALDNEYLQRYDKAIEDFGNAWREAQRALR